MAETRHGIVMTELMSATDDRSRMRSFKYGTVNATTKELTQEDIDNGNVVELTLPMLDRDVWTAVKPKANTAIENLALVTTPEMMYDERLKQLWQFYNVAEDGEAATGMLLKSGDIFSVTEEALDAAAAIAVGDIVELQADTKLKVVKTATASATQIGKVIDLNVQREGTYVGIKVN